MNDMSPPSNTKDPNRSLMSVLAGCIIFSMLALSAVGIMLVWTMHVRPADVYREAKTIQAMISELQDTMDQRDSAKAEAELVMDAMASTGEAIAVLDKNGLVLARSPGSEEMFGVTKSNALGYSPAFLIPPDMREDHRMAFGARMRRDGDPIQNTVFCTAQKHDGERIDIKIDVWALPGRIAVAIFTEAGAVKAQG